jgi:twitching motility protein PilT
LDPSDHDRPDGPPPEDIEPQEVPSFHLGGPLTPQEVEEVAGFARDRAELTAQFVPPPAPPPVPFEPRESARPDVPGNGHHRPGATEPARGQALADWALEGDPYEDADLPPDRRLEGLLRAVIAERGSDLHLVPGAPPLVRKGRGVVPLSERATLTPDGVEAMVSSILTVHQLERLRGELELNGAYSLAEARFRVNVHFQRGSMAAAFHLIPYDIRTVAELGLPGVVEDLARRRHGLVVVTGPSGSGKSTTLAAMVDVVNREREAHVLTVEDPIEFVHRHNRSAVTQREVGADTRAFPEALRQALRQDPDVIMVGEMADVETIATAVNAAESGHLVMAAMHTPDAGQTIDRLIDVFPSHQQQQLRVQLATTLQGVVAQQLVPGADGRSHLPACEVLVVTPAVRDLIREGKTDQVRSAILSGRKLGMVAMDSSLAQLLHSGRITRDAAFQHAHSPEQLNKHLSAGYSGGLPQVAG